MSDDWNLDTRSEWMKRLDLRTNMEQRAAVLTLLDCGVDAAVVAERIGVTTLRVTHIVERERPRRTRMLTKFLNEDGRIGSECSGCGNKVRAGRGSRRCGACAYEDVEDARVRDAEVLRDWARGRGYCPTANEAGEILGKSRSRAGEILVVAFGPDPRRGHERHGRRVYER